MLKRRCKLSKHDLGTKDKPREKKSFKTITIVL